MADGSNIMPYDFRTPAERLYDAHAEAHENGTCFKDCLICAEEEDENKNVLRPAPDTDKKL